MNRLTNGHLAAQMIEHSRRKAWSIGDGGADAEATLPGDPSSAIVLPAAAPLSARTFDDVITRRRSGGIVESGIDAAQLAALLGAFETRLPAELLPAPSLATLAFPVVLSVRGVPSAAYRYDAKTRRLLPIRAIERADFSRNVLLQWEHGLAAAVIFFVAPLSAWLSRCGDRGYRAAMLQAGWIADRSYLTAESLGLSYSASGGFAPVAADQLFSLDGYAFTALFSFVVGGERP
jgi:SagB-type dehydrogenase family enzyme